MPDLLNPSEMREHYIHQLKQTIHAYSATQIALGEVLQNAIDAITATGGGNHRIQLSLDFDDRTISVSDDGLGFPNDPAKLYLGGSDKRAGDKKLFGLVGVGLKVVLFRSERFSLRARRGDESFFVELNDAYRFDHDAPPLLTVPDRFAVDPTPLEHSGTLVEYRFPEEVAEDPIKGFVREMEEACLPHGQDGGLGIQLQRAVEHGTFPNRFAGLLNVYLRRFTYCGDVLNQLGQKPEVGNTVLHVTVRCADPVGNLGNSIGQLFDGSNEFEVDVPLTHLLAEEVRSWVPAPRPGLFREPLGRGGTNLQRTASAFNKVVYQGGPEYELLLTDKHGTVRGDNIDEYRTRLFPHINGIILTIGRIPFFEEYLPRGSRRVISANGAITTHDLDLTKGRNQEYVRCFDLLVDVDAELNYGKSQLKNNHLVNLIRRFVNDAYSVTIQTAAGNWVGRITTEEPEHDVFLTRPDLAVRDLCLVKQPRDENDVIGLFFELAGRGLLAGYRMFGLSQVDTYDARALIRRVGDREDPPVPADDRQLLVVEFKVHAAWLVVDLEREAKEAREINLLVTWDEGQLDSERFAFADIVHSRYHPDRVFPQVKRYLEDTRTGAQIQVLLLDGIVDELARQRGEAG